AEPADAGSPVGADSGAARPADLCVHAGTFQCCPGWMTPSWWRRACAMPQSTLAGRLATPGLDSGAHSEHAVERGTGRTGCVATSARVGRGPGPTDSRRTSPTFEGEQATLC